MNIISSLVEAFTYLVVVKYSLSNFFNRLMVK